MKKKKVNEKEKIKRKGEADDLHSFSVEKHFKDDNY